MVARQDLTTDPGLQEQLLQARRGTAFFARKLNELPMPSSTAVRCFPAGRAVTL